VMLVLGLKAKFCGLGLAIGWPWDCGLGFRGLVLADYNVPHELPSTRVNYISRSTFLPYLPWSPTAVRDGTAPASFPTGVYPCKSTKNMISLLHIAFALGWP